MPCYVWLSLGSIRSLTAQGSKSSQCQDVLSFLAVACSFFAQFLSFVAFYIVLLVLVLSFLAGTVSRAVVRLKIRADCLRTKTKTPKP